MLAGVRGVRYSGVHCACQTGRDTTPTRSSTPPTSTSTAVRTDEDFPYLAIYIDQLDRVPRYIHNYTELQLPPQPIIADDITQPTVVTHTHTHTHTHAYTYICMCVSIYISGVGRWRRGGGGRGAHRHVIYVPSVKNQYKRVVFGYMVIY